jgi:prepilin peptidase CpaA
VLLVPLLALVIATLFDVRTRQIPDSISIGVLLWAIAATAFGLSSHGWTSLVFGAGLALSIGVLLFWLGGFGGGDVKLLASLGATLGLQALPAFLFYSAIAGGILAAIALARGKRDLAYAPAMALGWVVFMMVRGSW